MDPIKEQEVIEQLESLKLELDKVSAESRHNWDLFLRCKAEIENIKKRTDKEILNVSIFALQNILTDFMPLLDSFELCIKNKSKDDTININGVILIYKMLFSILEKYNLKKIVINENEKLDILKHEVVSIVYDNNLEEDSIKSIMQNGYTLNDRILRYVKVEISKKIKD